MQNTTSKETGWLHTQFIFLYAAYVTLHISIGIMFQSFRHKGMVLRQHGNRLLHWWSKHLLKGIRFNFSVEGSQYLELDPTRRYVFMSNHCSFYDIPLMLLAAPKATIRMVTKKELFKVPIWGRALRCSEFIEIDRENRRLAIQQLGIAKEKMLSGMSLWISPEGTRSKSGELLPFKKGGFKVATATEAIIIPIFLENNEKIYNRKTKRFNFGLTSKVIVCPPIDTNDYKNNFDDLIAATRNALLQAQVQAQ